jgi:aspartate 1-decarboxylase
MYIELLKSKIHRVRITQAELDYVGSITIDKTLLTAAGIREYEKVQVVNVTNGARFETYAMIGEANSGIICVNGAAARLVAVGDIVIIMAYGIFSPEELTDFKPKIIFPDSNNQLSIIE